METLEAIRLAISVAAFVMSAVALWLSNRNWRQSNRPIVTAKVVARSAGNLGTAYEVVITNGGNRPAAGVRLECDDGHLAGALSGSAGDPLVEDVRACFKPEATVPLLLHGESVANAFGTTCRAEDGPTWKHGARIPVRVRYRDLSGRAYSERMDLVIRDSTAFAGGSWAKPKE